MDKKFVDTNILIEKIENRLPDLSLTGCYISSITALEFLNNFEQDRHYCAKYYVPGNNSKIPHFLKARTENTFLRRDHPFSKRLTDSIIFDFKGQFPYYSIFNNESISAAINDKLIDVFRMSIKFTPKKEYKALDRKYNFLLAHNLSCQSIQTPDIEMAYFLLKSFTEKYSIKNNFGNSWNDLLILSQCLNEKSTLFTEDSLLIRFSTDLLLGTMSPQANYMQIEFKHEDIESKKSNSGESKGYINRGWDYKIRKGL